MKKFAMTGVGGYIAPRHLKAIKDTGNILVAALDTNDSVGIIDSFFPQAEFFIEFERFDRHLERIRRERDEQIEFVSVCSPNYLHDAHIRFALRIGADVICEKPLVINSRNVKLLQEIEKESVGKVYNILQLRLHPSIIALKEKVAKNPDKIYDVDLTYITSRGKWYGTSWKGDMSKSGGIATNIGIHFFDMLSWIFGSVKENVVHVHNPTRAAGFLGLERANVRWFLSLNKKDLPVEPEPGKPATYRSITIDNDELEFSGGFTELHTESYKEILAGRGFGMDQSEQSIRIASYIRESQPIGLKGEFHPYLKDIEL